MIEKSNDEISNREFEGIIAGYNDDELRKVLKKRKLYQKEAADFAIVEAIRRGIIYSEQDLFASEFKHEPEKFSIFPTIENEKARTKFIKSITRSLLIIGAVPMVWGSVRFFEAQSLEGILIFIFGAAWSITSFQLMRSLNIKLIYFMFVLLILLVAYLVKTLISYRSINAMDIIVSIVSVGFIIYGIGFLNKLKD